MSGVADVHEAPPLQPTECSIPDYPRFVGLPDHPAIVELKSRARWVAWRYEIRNGRTTKPPVNPHTGGFASCSNPATWGTYPQAEQYALERGLPGVGCVLGEGDGDLTGIDLDKCRNPRTGKLKSWAQQIVDFNETYGEVSPSGTGIRLFARGKVHSATKYDPAKVEIYGSGRYLTVTGQGAPRPISEAPRTLGACQRRADRHQKAWACLATVGPRIAAAVKDESEKSGKRGSLRRALAAFTPEALNSAAGDNLNGMPRQGKRHKRGVLWDAIFGDKSDPFWRNVNDKALASLSVWVPDLFGAAAKISNKGYRVSSKDLGRDLEEDLSITPRGIKDFGVHDMGDANDGKRTPIDIVLEYGEPETAADAALWLCERLGIGPASLGWRSGTQNDQDDARSEENSSQEQAPPITKLTDWLTRDLPKPDLVQGEIMSTTSRVLLWAPTGIGKTMWGIASAMAMAAGHDFIGWRGHRTRPAPRSAASARPAVRAPQAATMLPRRRGV
jgi:hypothetical protein